jgi:DNA-binding MarR family transcriptional regulator
MGSAVGTIYLLKRAELAVRGCMDGAFAEVALTPSQYFILFLIKTGSASSSAELARAMGMLPQSMTELIAPLEKDGAITRQPDPTNNRILRIELTAAGERLFMKATQVAIRMERELLEGFDERELARLNHMFEALIATAEAHSHHPKVRSVVKLPAGEKNPRGRKAPAGRRSPATARAR